MKTISQLSTYSKSNYKLIVAILTDAGFFLNQKSIDGTILVADVFGVNKLLVSVWNHLEQFKGTIEIEETDNKMVVIITVK